jgi:hypothetical protein
MVGQLHVNLEKPKSSKNESNHIATFNQHPTPIFIRLTKMSTHNDGLNRGSKHNKSCTYDDRVLPNYGTGEARAKKKSHAERT